MTELELVTRQLEAASSYLDVFGEYNGEASAQLLHVKRIYRTLLKATHPDRFSEESDKQIASKAVKILTQWYEHANSAISNGDYGKQKALASVKTRKGTHLITQRLASGNIADVYRGTFDNEPVVYKIARNASDNDLLHNETRVLRKLRAQDTDATFHPYIPNLIDTFGIKESGVTRMCNAMTETTNLWTLTKVRDNHPNGVHPLDLAWIWRRLLVANGYAHKNGVIHGAVFPDHVLIEPDKHGVVLIDWCYATTKETLETYSPIIAITSDFRDWYPQEVISKEVPSPATDIYMAARTMAYLLGGDGATGQMPVHIPTPFKAFLRSCMQTNQKSRPQDAWVLLHEFDELLERLGTPYWPRKFRPFRITT